MSSSSSSEPEPDVSATASIFDAEERGRIKHHAERGHHVRVLRCASIPDMIARSIVDEYEIETTGDLFDALACPDTLEGIGPARAARLTDVRHLIGEVLGVSVPDHEPTDREQGQTTLAEVID